MLHTCSRCSRANPPEALYCYHDGAALMSGAAPGGPVRIGSQPFPQQFVFPNGRACRNFNQLALACQENWKESLEVLEKGYLASFLGGLGRSDLARAAHEAAHFPDHERGLDQFLAQIPNDVVQPPRLGVEPTVVNLGQLKVGEDRHLEIHLRNQGMRLLQGSVTSDSVWLTVGDAPGTAQKLFQFGKELVIGVHIRGKCLRASNKPMQGKLLVESNAGTMEVIVQLEVPVKPFADGVLAGAKSPRQLAEKAKANPKEAAELFESGAVARWYADSGWTYPVQGPTATGLAAVQQFFEALGLTPPPRVEVTPKSVASQGEPGGSVRETIEVRTLEKRPVYAHATSDQPWLKADPPRLSGRSATIPLAIAIPDTPDQTLTARLTVRANGNQRFTIPVTLTIGGRASPAPPPSPAPPVILATKPKPNSLHLLPATFLITALLGVVILDIIRTPPTIKVKPPEPEKTPIGEQRIDLSFRADNQRVGLSIRGTRDPINPDQWKRLTFSPTGDTNNTCVKLDGQENLYGQTPGAWAPRQAPREVIKGRKWTSTWRYTEKIYVTQTVMIVANEVNGDLDTCLMHYLIDNQDTVPHKVGLRVMLDTFIGANDGVPFVIPGQPGLVDSRIDLTNTKDIPDFVQALERPDLASPGATAHLGVKLPTGLRLHPEDPVLEPVSRFVICRWPGNPEIRWNVPVEEMKGDSCVLLYWDYRTMPPGEKRALAFTYGLGLVTTDTGNSQLAVTYGPARPAAGEEFTVSAYVRNPAPSQTVTITLPARMTVKGPATQALPGADKRGLSQVSWKVAINSKLEEGEYLLRVQSADNNQKLTVPVRRLGIFEPRCH